jgi:addiction module RelB/DinJ family antitoxin
MNTTLQVRIDKKTKEKARKAFKAAGIDLSSGLRLFLTHIGRTGEVPMEMFTYDNAPDSFKKKLVKEADEAYEEYKKGKVKVYYSAKELLDDILGPEK